MDYLIGLDIGTSAVKAVLMNALGDVVGTCSEPFTYTVEGKAKFLDPDHYCGQCFSAICKLAAQINDGKVAAVCSCCASGNPLFLDAGLKPLTPIIGWQTAVDWDVLDRVYTKEEQDAFYRIVGWDFFDGKPAANLSWILVNRPDILENTRFLAMSAEYMNFKLTGRWGISHSMGTPSYLMDQEKGVYNQAMLRKFGLSEEMLPPIYDKGTVLGTILPEMAEELGLSSDTAVVLGSFDHPSGALGAGVIDEGEMLLSCGTSWVELFPLANREHGLSTGGLVDRFMLEGAPYCVMKSLESVSDKITFYRKTLLGDIPHSENDALIGQSKPGAGGLRIDFSGEDLERASSFGRPDIARAIIEGAAYMLRDNLKQLESCGLFANNITAIGGITNSAACVGVISQVLGRDIKVVNGQSAGAVGSCLLAGVGTGIFASERDAVNVMMRLKS